MIDRAALAPANVIDAPAPRFRVPVPLAASVPFAVLGLMASAALAPLALILPLTLTLFAAVSVRVVLALQETESLTLMLPPLPPPVTKEVPVLLKMAKFVELRSLLNVAPVISPPVGATVKSVGSMSQVPVRPLAAAVVTFAPFATSTTAPLVSIKPPLPLGALASSVPPTLTVPAVMPPRSSIIPLRLSTVRASMMPVLLTTLASSAFFAPALMITKPPSASISCWFWARLFSVF